jgi:hypothetical protein
MQRQQLQIWETGDASALFTAHDLIRNLQRSVGDVRSKWNLPRPGGPFDQDYPQPRLF